MDGVLWWTECRHGGGTVVVRIFPCCQACWFYSYRMVVVLLHDGGLQVVTLVYPMYNLVVNK